MCSLNHCFIKHLCTYPSFTHNPRVCDLFDHMLSLKLGGASTLRKLQPTQLHAETYIVHCGICQLSDGQFEVFHQGFVCRSNQLQCIQTYVRVLQTYSTVYTEKPRVLSGLLVCDTVQTTPMTNSAGFWPRRCSFRLRSSVTQAQTLSACRVLAQSTVSSACRSKQVCVQL